MQSFNRVKLNAISQRDQTKCNPSTWSNQVQSLNRAKRSVIPQSSQRKGQEKESIILMPVVMVCQKGRNQSHHCYMHWYVKKEEQEEPNAKEDKEEKEEPITPLSFAIVYQRGRRKGKRKNHINVQNPYTHRSDNPKLNHHFKRV